MVEKEIKSQIKHVVFLAHIEPVKDKKSFDVVFKHQHLTSEVTSLVKLLNHAMYEAKELYDIEKSYPGIVNTLYSSVSLR